MHSRTSPAPHDSGAQPSVTVVLLCRNEIDHIENCLNSILAQVPPPGGFEVLVVDGMSDDGTREILKRVAAGHKSLRILDNPQRITPCAMNIGIRAARGQWIAIMGSHNCYAEDYLAKCYETALETHADNVGGALICQGRTILEKAIAAAHHSAFAIGGAKWHNTQYEGPADTVFGGFYKREVFERIGTFDEDLVRNQDDELNLRLTRSGGTIWHSPKIKSWYCPRNSLRALFKQYMQYGYWKVRVIQKHKLPASIRHLVPGAFVLVLMVLFLLSAFRFLLSAFAPNSQLSALSIPLSIFSFPVSAFSFQLFSFSFPAALASYLLAVLVASVLTAAKTEWKLLPVLPLVFPCYHFGYGIGFLRGIWDFVILRRGASVSFTNLTRESTMEAKPAPRSP